MDRPDWYAKWRHDAVHELMNKNLELEGKFNLGRWERWDYDLDAGSLVFSHDGKPRVRADIQVVGSIAHEAGTWLWSWDNASLSAANTEDAHASKAFGDHHGIAELTTGLLQDDSLIHLGWELTAVTARIAGSMGGYLAPDGRGAIFLVYRQIVSVS